MSQLVTIGELLFDSENHGGVRVVVSGFDSSRKITTQAGQGDDDPKVTRGGREARSFTITLDCAEGDDSAEAKLTEAVTVLDASVPTTKATKPLAFGYEVNGIDVTG